MQTLNTNVCVSDETVPEIVEDEPEAIDDTSV